VSYQTIPAGTVPGDWRPGIAARVKGYISTLTRMAVSSNGTNIAGEMNLGSATGTGTVLPAAIDGGGTTISSGASAGGVRVASLGGNASVGTYVNNARTTAWAIYQRAKIATAVASGAEIAVMCCLQDGTNDNYLGQAAATSTTNWVFVINGAATDTTVAFDTNWNDLLLINDGTTVTAYVNWVAVGSGLATGIAAAAGWARSYCSNAAVNGTVNFHINRWAMFTADP